MNTLVYKKIKVVLTVTQSRILYQVALDGPLQVESGNILTSDKKDLVVASGSSIYIYSPRNDSYQSAAVLNLAQPVLSLEVGFSAFGQNFIFAGTEDRIIAFGNVGGAVTQLWQTDPEPGANIRGITLADLDGDKREELAAIGSGNDTLYVYLLTGENISLLRPQLLSIRQLPGSPQYITAFSPEPNKPLLLAIAYGENQVSSIVTYYMSESGFEEGPGLAKQPYSILGLTSGDLLPDPGEELVTAGNDGFLRIYTSNNQLRLGLISKNLGAKVSSVEARLTGESKTILVAGTPGGFVFGFNNGINGITSDPDWAFKAGGPVNDLDIIDKDKVAVGTQNGLLQVLLNVFS